MNSTDNLSNILFSWFVKGVESFDVDIDQQKVTVIGNIEPQVIFDKVSRTGKKTEFWKDEVVEAPSTTTTT